MTGATYERLVLGFSADGDVVAECELDAHDVPIIDELVEGARAGGAARLWVHSAADLSPYGFRRTEGFCHYEGDVGAGRPGDELPLLSAADVGQLLDVAFGAQWGHKQPDPTWRASAEARWLGLGLGDGWVGLCRVEPAARYVDGPGVVPAHRSPLATERLLRGAFWLLGPGPVTVDAWGDPADAYLHAGLRLAEHVPGWELQVSAA